jgi:hypothetical protein
MRGAAIIAGERCMNKDACVYWLALSLIVACGSDTQGSAPKNHSPEIAAGIEGSADQRQFLDDHPDAASAVGSFTHDASSGELVLMLKDSELACGLEAETTLDFSVISVDEDTLVTKLSGGENTVTWSRVGAGEGVTGTWKSVDRETTYLLTLTADGELLLSVDGQDEASCGDDGKSNTGYTTEDGCYVDRMPTATITVDGEIDDWSSVKPVEDSETDSASAAGGDELAALYVASSEALLFVRVQFAESIEHGVLPSGSWEIGWSTEQGLGKLRVRNEHGALGVFDGKGGEQVAAVGGELELSIPWRNLGGRTQLLRLQASVISDEPGADPLDDGLCFSEANATATK